ncbi:MAG: hypothetical protein RL213_2053 [Bacteroidota bacterium]|jgi:hypothetical protein
MHKSLNLLKNPYLLAGALASLLALTGCEKTVTVELPESEPLLVVEGYVEPGIAPYLFLSRSLAFFGSINLNTVVENSVSGATVVVDDGITSDTLVQPLPGLGYYVSTRITGAAGRTYRLTISAEGKTISSSTYMPLPVPLDSVWWKPDGERDSLGFAWAHLTEPDTFGNNYRWFARRINRYTYGRNAGQVKDSVFLAPLGSVFEDKFINGRSFDFNVVRGKAYNSNKEDDLFEENFFFKRGDTIAVKFCSIDRASFEFWRSEETQVSNSGNPFGSVTPVNGNIAGGLGIWCAYSTTYDTIIAR